jgi:hypothetical protein
VEQFKVSLDKPLADWVRSEAKRRHAPESQIIREAVATVVNEQTWTYVDVGSTKKGNRK